MKLALICDDDQHIRDLVQAILEGSGYKVVAAENGKVACDMLQDVRLQKSADLIVLDVKMPIMTGLDVLDKIREMSCMDHVPVLMLTAEGSHDDVMAGYEKGAAYYITKPFTKQQLLYGIQLVSE
jgi:DNA-binding response OmpR family regulator